MDEKKFFESLKKKISQQPDRHFDQTFWSKFESEFSPRKAEKKGTLWYWVLGSAATAALAILVIVPTLREGRSPEQTASNEGLADIVGNEALLEDLDMLAEFDDLAIEDDDWAVLLPQEES